MPGHRKSEQRLSFSRSAFSLHDRGADLRSADPVTYARRSARCRRDWDLIRRRASFRASFKVGRARAESRSLAGGVVTNVQIFATRFERHGRNPPGLFFLAPTGAVNISTRLAVGTGENVLIGGFITTGNAPKKVLIARYRTFAAAVEHGALPDPYLGSIAHRYNWPLMTTEGQLGGGTGSGNQSYDHCPGR